MADDIVARDMRAPVRWSLRRIAQGSSDARAIALPPNQVEEMHCFPMQSRGLDTLKKCRAIVTIQTT